MDDADLTPADVDEDGGGSGARPASDWLDRKQAAAYAAVSLSTIDRAVRDGHLQSSTPRPRVRRFRRVWLDEWLAGGGAVLWALLALGVALGACYELQSLTGRDCPFL